MEKFNFLHELVLGALTGNIVIFIGIIRFGLKVYKHYDAFTKEHHLMWQDYCKRYKLKYWRDINDRPDTDSVS